jgi:hypothetical protein
MSPSTTTLLSTILPIIRLNPARSVSSSISRPATRSSTRRKAKSRIIVRLGRATSSTHTRVFASSGSASSSAGSRPSSSISSSAVPATARIAP